MAKWLKTSSLATDQSLLTCLLVWKKNQNKNILMIKLETDLDKGSDSPDIS